MRYYAPLLGILLALAGCHEAPMEAQPPAAVRQAPLDLDSLFDQDAGDRMIHTGRTSPAELLSFAETLVGKPYSFGCSDTSNGFDCSGFLFYVFHHFGIQVPRSSIDYTHAGKTIPRSAARPGDLILFTGTDSTQTQVGHIGIVYRVAGDSLRFLHASSGKSQGVTFTTLNDYYQKRFVKIIRIFPQNELPERDPQ